MVYRKKVRKWKKATKKHRFPEYFQKYMEEKQREETRSVLTTVLKKYQQKRINREWNNLVVAVLPKMKGELEDLGEIPADSVEVIRYVIKFMDIVSRYQDSFENGRINFELPSKKEVIEKFNYNVYIAGRHLPSDKKKVVGIGEVHFWNQSFYKEPVSENNVFFGQDLSLMEMPASYWINLPKTKKNKICLRIIIKGCFGKSTSKLWATDAIVKFGKVRSRCISIRNNLLECIDDIISTEDVLADA